MPAEALSELPSQAARDFFPSLRHDPGPPPPAIPFKPLKISSYPRQSGEAGQIARVLSRVFA